MKRSRRGSLAFLPILEEGEFHGSHGDPQRMVAKQTSIDPHLEPLDLELGMTH